LGIRYGRVWLGSGGWGEEEDWGKPDLVDRPHNKLLTVTKYHERSKQKELTAMLIATSTLKPNSLARKTGAPQKATVSEVETAGQDRYDPSPVAVESKPRVYREKAMGAGKLGGALGIVAGLGTALAIQAAPIPVFGVAGTVAALGTWAILLTSNSEADERTGRVLMGATTVATAATATAAAQIVGGDTWSLGVGAAVGWLAGDSLGNILA
jgi:hypothetical protein